jgi:hypothetical protein
MSCAIVILFYRNLVYKDDIFCIEIVRQETIQFSRTRAHWPASLYQIYVVTGPRDRFVSI